MPYTSFIVSPYHTQRYGVDIEWKVEPERCFIALVFRNDSYSFTPKAVACWPNNVLHARAEYS